MGVKQMPSQDENLPARVSAAVLAKYDAYIGQRQGMGTRVINGALEWTILSGICLVSPGDEGVSQIPRVEVIAFGTGTKALPYDQVRQARGDLLHDCHAEVMTRRSARQWICERIIAEKAAGDAGDESALVDGLPLYFECEPNNGRRRLKSNVKVWWYISTLPCGECSSPALSRRHQLEDLETRKPHAEAPPPLPQQSPIPDSAIPSTRVFRGRESLQDTDVAPMLRTVPGRADSPPSLSHSCTDKLLMWSLVGWQGSALCRWINPIGIDALVIASGEEEEHDGQSVLVCDEVMRGLDIQRRHASAGQARLGVALEPTLAVPKVFVVPQSFRDGSEATVALAAKLAIPRENVISAWSSQSWVRPSPRAHKAMHSPHQGRQTRLKELETAVNGVKQGASTRRPRTPNGTRGVLAEKSRSRLCKLEFMRTLTRVAAALEEQHVCTDWNKSSYAALKGKAPTGGKPLDSNIAAYRSNKALLRGQTLSDGAETRRIEEWLHARTLSGAPTPVGSSHTGGDEMSVSPGDGNHEPPGHSAPLAGWLVTPAALECFNLAGERVSSSA